MEEERRIVVVQLEVVHAEQHDRDLLHALRNVQHRMLNAALTSWWASEGKDRAAATQAVQDVLDNERLYWEKQVPQLHTGIEKLRAKKPRDEAKQASWQRDMDDLLRRIKRAEVCSELRPPSAIYDACVYFTRSKYGEYRKHSFRGDKTMATFRHGQPVRTRDGSWELTRAERSGSYDLSFPVMTDGRRIQKAILRVIPDGGSMYGWTKKLVDGEAKPCDARLVYAEGKKKWYAKLTISVPRERLRPIAGVAAMRRGIHSAFVVVAQNGDVLTIDGGDVIHHKAKANARRMALGRHLRSTDIGNGARGHGKKRRFAALERVDHAEKKFVDAKLKQWAATSGDRTTSRLTNFSTERTSANQVGIVPSSKRVTWWAKPRSSTSGLPPQSIAARHKNVPERTKMIRHFESSRKENGKPLSERQVREVRMRLSKETRESGYAQRTARREGREHDLYAENVKLKKQIKVLEKENRELQAKLTKITGGAMIQKSGSGKSTSKSV